MQITQTVTYLCLMAAIAVITLASCTLEPEFREDESSPLSPKARTMKQHVEDIQKDLRRLEEDEANVRLIINQYEKERREITQRDPEEHAQEEVGKRKQTDNEFVESDTSEAQSGQDSRVEALLKEQENINKLTSAAHLKHQAEMEERDNIEGQRSELDRFQAQLALQMAQAATRQRQAEIQARIDQVEGNIQAIQEEENKQRELTANNSDLEARARYYAPCLREMYDALESTIRYPIVDAEYPDPEAIPMNGYRMSSSFTNALGKCPAGTGTPP